MSPSLRSRVTIALLCLTAGCAAARSNPVTLAERIPPGTSLDQAMQQMKAEKFEHFASEDCANFTAMKCQGDAPPEEQILRDIRFARFVRKDTSGWVTTGWDVALILDDDDTVREVAFNMALTGP